MSLPLTRTTILDLCNTSGVRLSLLSREVSSIREYRHRKDERLEEATSQITIVTHVIWNLETGLERTKKSLSEEFLGRLRSDLQDLMGITDALAKHISEIRSNLKTSIFNLTGPCKLKKAEDRLVSIGKIMVATGESLRLLLAALLGVF